MKGILMIDDIGSEKLTDWVGETFYSIINTRYEKMLPTFFQAIFLFRNWRKKWEIGLLQELLKCVKL